MTATDLVTGNPIIYKTGDLVDAVVQSSTIPGFVEPTYQNNRMLVDGGISLPTPVTPLIGECDFIISINITRGVSNQPEPNNIFEILNRSRDISIGQLNKYLLEKANFIIKPEHNNLHWSAFDKSDEFLKVGEKAASDSIESLLNALDSELKDEIKPTKETFWTRIKKRLFS